MLLEVVSVDREYFRLVAMMRKVLREENAALLWVPLRHGEEIAFDGTRIEVYKQGYGKVRDFLYERDIAEAMERLKKGEYTAVR